MNRRASSTEGVQRAQEWPESPLCTSWAPFLCFYPPFPHINPAPRCCGSLGSFSKPRLGGGCAFPKDALFSSPRALSFLLSPGQSRVLVLLPFRSPVCLLSADQKQNLFCLVSSQNIAYFCGAWCNIYKPVHSWGVCAIEA